MFLLSRIDQVKLQVLKKTVLLGPPVVIIKPVVEFHDESSDSLNDIVLQWNTKPTLRNAAAPLSPLSLPLAPAALKLQ